MSLPNILSTVHRGTLFEQHSLNIVSKHLGIHLRRVGGKSDGGIDLIGWWNLPHAHSNNRIRIIAQCKAEKKKTGPKYIRELEGVISRYHPSSEEKEEVNHVQYTMNSPVAALLFSSSDFTKEAKIRALSSTKPFCLIHLPLTQDSQGADSIGSVVWNDRLSQLLGDIELRQEYGSNGDEKRLALWRAGERLQIHPS